MCPWAFNEHRLEPVLLEYFDGGLGARHQPVVDADAHPDKLQSLLERGVVEVELMRGLPFFLDRKSVV